jgi:undecaprenyl-phosphate 4-deoxy-4-formamido-L-arabinose transferase
MTSDHKTRVSVIIPVFNSENSIIPLVTELVNALTVLYDPEIILVNDQSADQSDRACLKLYEMYRNVVKYYSLAKNVGEHNAVMAGLNQMTGEYAVIMDDDFQNPVSEVIKLISYSLTHEYDVVYTWYEKRQHSFFRNLGSNFNNMVANVMLKKPRDLYLSSFKLMNRYLVNEIIRYDLPFPYIDGLILRTTSHIGKMQVMHDKRTGGRSNYTLRKLVRLWMNMFTNFSILPLRISIMMGFAFAAIGMILGLYTVIEKILNPDLPLGYASLVVAISVFSGIQLIAIGMLGEYLGRMFLSHNKKPQYSIRKRFE